MMVTVEQALREIREATSPAEREALKVRYHAVLHGSPPKVQGREWNYAADYSRHGGYDGWDTNADY